MIYEKIMQKKLIQLSDLEKDAKLVPIFHHKALL